MDAAHFDISIVSAIETHDPMRLVVQNALGKMSNHSLNFRLYRIFRFRSRFVDHYVLAAAIPLILLGALRGGTAIVLFVIIGTYVCLFKSNTRRQIDKPLFWSSWALAAYALVSFGLSVLNDFDCLRYMPHFTELLFFPFLSAALVLVQNPLHWIALGAKAALCYFAVIALMSLEAAFGRLGFGTNPVIAAYFLMLLGCLCRFDNRASPKINLAFFYLSFIPVVATGTRIALVFYVLMAIIDIALAARKFLPALSRINQIKVVFISAAALGLLSIAAVQSPVVQLRISDTFIETQGLNTDIGAGSLRIRSVIWETGIDTFLSEPVFGAGLCQSINNITAEVQKIDPTLKFKFFHNMLLDPLAFFGLIGFALFCWWCFATVKAIWPVRQTPETLAVVCLLLMIFIYGLTGNFLSDDRMIGSTFLVFAVLICEKRKMQIKAKIQN